MKTLLLYIFLWFILTSCKKNAEPKELDAATEVAGVYDLTYSTAYNKEVTDVSGSLTLVRIDPRRVKPSFNIYIADSLIGGGYWQLTKVNEDSVSIEDRVTQEESRTDELI